MKKFILILFILLWATSLLAEGNEETETSSPKDTLVVIWSSGDPEVAEKVCLMYTHASAKYDWFEQVTLIVWGPSANLLANNKTLQDKIKAMNSDGIKLQACVVCADSYGVSDKLRDIGIEVIGMGKPLTNYLKKGYSVLNF